MKCGNPKHWPFLERYESSGYPPPFKVCPLCEKEQNELLYNDFEKRTTAKPIVDRRAAYLVNDPLEVYSDE